MSRSLKHLGFKPIDVILVVTWNLLQKQNPTVNPPGFSPPFVTFIYVLFCFVLLTLRTPHTFPLGVLVFPESKVFQLEMCFGNKKWKEQCGGAWVSGLGLNPQRS